MKTILFSLTILFATACNNGNADLDDARATIKAECGDAPLAPGYSVAREQVNGMDKVLMSPTDWQNMQDYIAANEAYSACVQGFAVNK